MRVIAGSRKGLKLQAPKGDNTRPTEDRIKENIFNLMGQDFYNAQVLDLFAGSGAIGIEFLSRGAEKVYFVDTSRESIEVIKENIKKAHFEEESVVLKSNAKSALKKLSDQKFDYIYLDPPYKNKELYISSIETILEYDILNKNGYIVIEQVKDLDIDFAKYLNNVKFKNYGSKSVGIWEKKWK